MSECQNETTVEPTPEEIAEISEILGGPVEPIVLTKEEWAEVDRFLAFVDKYGHLP